jgi:hypothetical protein
MLSYLTTPVKQCPPHFLKNGHREFALQGDGIGFNEVKADG